MARGSLSGVGGCVSGIRVLRWRSISFMVLLQQGHWVPLATYFSQFVRIGIPDPGTPEKMSDLFMNRSLLIHSFILNQ